MRQCTLAGLLQRRFGGNVLTFTTQQSQHRGFPHLCSTIRHFASRFAVWQQSLFEVGKRKSVGQEFGIAVPRRADQTKREAVEVVHSQCLCQRFSTSFMVLSASAATKSRLSPPMRSSTRSATCFLFT